MNYLFVRKDNLLFISIIACAAIFFSRESATAQGLEDYAKRVGPPKRVETISMIKEDRWAVSFVSQEWQGKEWNHTLLVVEPSKPKDYRTVLLYVAGSSNVDKYAALLKTIAEESGALCAVVGSVPNQPMFERSEDALLAYSFEQFRQTGDATWPILFPMVTTVSKAIDVLQQQIESRHKSKGIRVVVAGASKRGWTSWLAPLIDKRIVATAPAVFDFLNFPEQIRRAREAYGQDSEKIKNYTELGLTDRLKDPRIEQLQKWIDPYNRREQLDLPKLALLGANDPYWVVDSMDVYWNDLIGEKIAFMLPNVGHDVMDTDEAALELAHFIRLIALKEQLPWINWTVTSEKGGASINVVSGSIIERATKWVADSPTADFRKAKWSPTDLQALSTNQGSVGSMVRFPESGSRAFFVTIEVKTAAGPIWLSTAPRVLKKTRK